MKPTKSTRFQIYSCTKLYMFRVVPLPIIRSTFGTGTCCTGLTTASMQDQDGSRSILILHASCRQTCIACASAKCTVANS